MTTLHNLAHSVHTTYIKSNMKPTQFLQWIHATRGNIVRSWDTKKLQFTVKTEVEGDVHEVLFEFRALQWKATVLA